VWDASTGSEVTQLVAGLDGGVESLAFGSGGLFASASADLLALWDVDTWLFRALRLEGFPGGPYTAVAFAPDGQTLASSAARFAPADDGTVLLWDMPAGVARGDPLEAGRFRGEGGPFSALAYRPDGHLLAGASKDGVQLWDVELDQPQPIGGSLGTSPASSVAFSPDGSQVMAGTAAGVVSAYPATTSGWLRRVCAVVSRNLTQREWESFVGPETPYHRTCRQYPSG
jgi:WD40 repeat protein